MARYNYSIMHVPGKLLHLTLSRAPTALAGEAAELEEEVELYVEGVVGALPVTGKRLQENCGAQAQDEVCSQVMQYCQNDWPGKDSITSDVLPYWKVRNSLTVHNGLLLYNDRIGVPKVLQNETMLHIHEGHQGIERCRLHAKTSVRWPKISKKLTEMVKHCIVCERDSVVHKEPLLTTPLPDYQWQILGTDLFTLKREQYLVVVDFFSLYPEVVKLSSTLSACVIAELKSVFSRHGIPEIP